MQEEVQLEKKNILKKIALIILKLIIIEQIIIVLSLGIDLYNVIIINGQDIYSSVINDGLSIYEAISKGAIQNLSRIRIGAFVIILNIGYFVLKLAKYKKIVLGEKIYKYRFWIAGIIFVLCVLFRMNGSSISCWNGYIGNETTGIVLGKNRGIRSDEWAVFTPMGMSQYYNDFASTSTIIRGTESDVYIVYGQPVKDINIIFRPFQIGYLFLNQEMGLSFFWCGRFIALLLVTFEFGMLITNKNKKLSLVLAIMIALSPTVQWWFAVNRIS